MSDGALQWRPAGPRDTYVAYCGMQHQGRALVWRDDGGWHWELDMLPGDVEPAIRSTRAFPTAEDAMAMADAQDAIWPVLVKDAAR